MDKCIIPLQELNTAAEEILATWQEFRLPQVHGSEPHGSAAAEYVICGQYSFFPNGSLELHYRFWTLTISSEMLVRPRYEKGTAVFGHALQLTLKCPPKQIIELHRFPTAALQFKPHQSERPTKTTPKCSVFCLLLTCFESRLPQYGDVELHTGDKYSIV